MSLASLHKWVGLSIAIFVALEVLTGIALVYRADLTAVLSGNTGDNTVAVTTDVGDGSHELAVGSVVAAVHRDYRRHRVTRIVPPKTATHPYLIYLAPRDGSGSSKVVSAEVRRASVVLAEGGVGEFMQFLFDLHLSIANGKPGRILVGVFGAGLLVMCATGLMLWWPGLRRLRGSLRVSRRRPPIVYYWQLHRAVGVVGVPVAIVALISGVFLAFAPQLRTALDAAPPAPPASQNEMSPCEPGSFDTRLDLARRQYPASRIRDIRFAADGVLQRVLIVNRTRFGVAAPHQIWLHPCRLRVAMVHDASRPKNTNALLLDWLYPIHTGIAFGRGGQFVVLVSGVALMAMLITGGALWYRRRRRSSSR